MDWYTSNPRNESKNSGEKGTHIVYSCSLYTYNWIKWDNNHLELRIEKEIAKAKKKEKEQEKEIQTNQAEVDMGHILN